MENSYSVRLILKGRLYIIYLFVYIIYFICIYEYTFICTFIHTHTHTYIYIYIHWILYQLSHKGSPGILEWVAYPFSNGSSQPKNQTGISCIAGGFLTN